MLIPRFSLRWMFGATSGMALFAWVVSLAVRGRMWAVAICAAVGLVPITFLLYAILFLVAFAVARVLKWKQFGSSPDGNPFVDIGPTMPRSSE